jgi:hypothetical protein
VRRRPGESPFSGTRNCRLGGWLAGHNQTVRKEITQHPLWTSSSHGSLFPPSLSVSSKKRAVRDSSFGDAMVRRFFVHTGPNAMADPSLLPFDSNASPANPPLGNLKAPPSVLSISPWSVEPLTKLDHLVWTCVPISTLSRISSPGFSRLKL